MPDTSNPQNSSPSSKLFLSIPNQERCFFGFGILCQIVKLSNLIRPHLSLADGLRSYTNWLFFDFLYCVIQSQLRLPGLPHTTTAIFLQLLSLWVLGAAVFVGSRYSDPEIPSVFEPLALFSLLNPFAIQSIESYAMQDSHLLGKDAIRMSSIHTARLNPDSLGFCIAPEGKPVFIPVLVDDANVAGLRYSFTPLVLGDGGYSHTEHVYLTAKRLKAIERLHIENPAISPEVSARGAVRTPNYRRGALVYVQVSGTGNLRLERVLYPPNIDAHIISPFEISIPPCPHAEFAAIAPSSVDIRCSGQESDSRLFVDVYGIPPLTLKWSKITHGKQEHFVVRDVKSDGATEPKLRRAGGYEGRNPRIPREIRIPLEVPSITPGDHLYVLDELIDAVGNVVYMDVELVSTDMIPSTKTIHSFTVLRRPTASFKDCSPETPTYIRRGFASSLSISANTTDDLSSSWEVKLRYQPSFDFDNGGRRASELSPWERSFTNQGDEKDIRVPAIAFGDYTIIMVKGKQCHGEVLPPDTCKVIERPLPAAEIKWKKLHDCSGEKGISVSLTFSGTPPFAVTYNVQREDEFPEELSKTFMAAHGKIEVQPSRGGRYTFAFIRVSDAYYDNVGLPGPQIEQSIAEPATVVFTSGKFAAESNKRILDSCDTVIGVNIELTGSAPWTLEVKVRNARDSQLLPFAQISSSPKTLDIAVPEALEKQGGTFDIELVSIEDSRECKQAVSTPGILVNLRKIKPTVQFDGEENQYNVVVLDREVAELPLWLTGHPPWLISYRRDATNEPTLNATLHAPSSNLSVTHPGLYRIIDISDSQCPGTVVSNASSYKVDWIPKPSAKLSPQMTMSYGSSNRSHILKPACQGDNDHIDIDLTGRPPFHVVYNILEATIDGAKLPYNPTFYSTHNQSQLQLQTSNVGRVFYEISQLGDAIYPLTNYKGLLIPRSERLLFEQQVLLHPSVRFKTQGRLLYRLYDTFLPTSRSPEGTVILEGVPPFQLQLSIQHLASNQIDWMTAEVLHTEWKINLTTFTFTTIGSHLVTIESVSDASNCPQVPLDSSSNSIFVDVGAGADIVPYDQREYFCAGEVARFHLEGIAPWGIVYRMNGHSYTTEAVASPFSVLMERPGDFKIISITHQETLLPVTLNLSYVVHPHPSALVAYNNRIDQDIDDGDQVEVVFTLIGVPPFTFTYQRSGPPFKTGGRTENVLETHTVSHLTTHSYIIHAPLEGTWKVTSIADARCHYP